MLNLNFMLIRPDYKRLGVFKQNYQNVPIMALTATATQRVRKDVLHQLNIKETKWYNIYLIFDKYVSKTRMNFCNNKTIIAFLLYYYFYVFTCNLIL